MSATIVLGSTGGAAEYRGAFLGEFVELEEKHNERPSYRQRETEGGQEKLLRFDQNSWWVSSVLRNGKNTTLPPTTGWEYLSNDKKWKSDDTTFELEYSSLAPCPLVKVEAYGEVRKYISHKMGNYSILENRWSSGRPVYQINTPDQKWYLLVPNRTTIWVIRSSITNKRKRMWVVSGRATNLPTDVEAGPRPDDGVEQWRYWVGNIIIIIITIIRYWDGNGYKEGNISITCSS